MADDVKNVVINDWGNLTASVRTRASGKERVTLEIRGDALLINTDEKSLMKPIAEALAGEITRQIRAFALPAKPATVLARKAAKKAYASGKAWARKRYSGGRIGPMEPDSVPGDSLLNDSGRLAKSIVVGVTNAKEHVVNVAANRLGPEPLVRQRTLALLRPLVQAAMKSDAAKKGVEIAKGLLVRKEREAKSQLMEQLKATLEASQQLKGAAEQFEEGLENR